MVRFGILGAVEVADRDRRIAVRGPRQVALLAFLLLHANRAVSVDQLTEALWGNQDPSGAVKRVQVAVGRLRKALEVDDNTARSRLRSTAGGYLLAVAPGELDADVFGARIEEGLRVLESGDPDRAAELLRDALSLWRGPPLADVAYENFAQGEIWRLEELRSAAIEARVDADLQTGQHAAVIGELGALLAAHPARERLAELLMLALYRSGRQADALEIYRRTRVHLTSELGLEPGPALEALQAQILGHDRALARSDPGARLERSVPNRGNRGGEDERGFMTGPQPQRPPALGTATVGREHATREIVEHNLPVQVSSFVGRDVEMKELRRLLPERRMLTLTGSGGVGKTRLAQAVAASLLDRSTDGVWFIDLAPLADSSLVAATVTGVLGLREEPGRPAREVLTSALSNRSLLLILDNCEHVVGEAASVAEQLIGACPGIVILATSREPLRIPGEQVYRVPSLSLPPAGAQDPDRLLDSAAARLFVDRAVHQRPGFALDRDNSALVARVCRRLDGIPLAIELATARLRSLSLVDLEARLDDRFRLLTGGNRTALPRQQTLEAMIDWSYELLSPTEQEVLEHLSVFPGGFDLEAAEAVATPGQRSWALNDVVALVDKSLVQSDDNTSRYRLLESVREYAAARLRARSADAARAARAAHRDHYLVLAESARPHLIGRDQARWLDRLQLELDNLRAAISECASDPDPEPGLRLADALRYFWAYRQPTAEGAQAVCAALDRPDAGAPTLARGRALVAAGHLLADIDPQYSAAVARLHEAAAIGRALFDEHLRTEALHGVLTIDAIRVDEDAHDALTEEGLRAARALDDPHLTAQMLMAAASSTRVAHSQSLRRFEDALALARQTGDQVLSVRALAALGYSAMYAGEISVARARLDEAVRLFRDIGDQSGLSHSACNLGFALYVAGSNAPARAMFDETLQIARHHGDWLHVAYAQLGRALIKTRAGDAKGAATLHGTADALHDNLGTRVRPFESRLRDADIAALRATLGDDAFELAFDAGRTQTPQPNSRPHDPVMPAAADPTLRRR
jgi:predicted ATPase/DNA-binding SARP family transcriptional activator